MVKRFFWAIILLLALSLHSRGASSEAPIDGLYELLFFWGTGCPHCEEAKPFLDELQEKYPALVIRRVDIMESRENLALWTDTARGHGSRPEGVPAFFIGGKAFSGFTPEIAARIEREVASLSHAETEGRPHESDDPLTLFLPGGIDPATISLPLFTVIIAGLDSFNPCAFFVLLSLLGLLVHAGSRRRMFLVGGVFVSFSAILYFLFMAAWLNVFLLAGNLSVITAVAGGVALFVGGVNVKDFFFYKRGVTLSIPESARPKLFARMRGLIRVESMTSILSGTVLLALAANSYELLCTAGFPMIYTRTLTLKELPALSYYLYLALYNVIYVVPLVAIVAVFAVTLSSRKLSENAGKSLKLLSGTMMLLLGATLLLRAELMSDPFWAIALLMAASLTTFVASLWQRRKEFADLS